MSQTILVVDDSQTIRKVVDMALKVAPLGVLQAGTAAEALTKAEEDPRVVLVDYHLPDASGYEVCEKLKSRLDAPVIMLAGQRHGFDKQKAQQAGVDDVIPKPFDTDTLLDAIVGATGLEKRDMVKRLGDSGPDTGKTAMEKAQTDGSQASGGSGGSRSGARRPSPESGSGSNQRFQPAARSDEGGSQAGSSASSKPRMRTPDQDQGSQSQSTSGSSAGGSGGSKPRFQPGDRSGSQAESQSAGQSGARRGGSGASSPGASASGGASQSGGAAGESAQSGGQQAGGGDDDQPDIDIDLESSADHKAEPDSAPGGSGSKPVTTPESQAGGGSTPADMGPAGGGPSGGVESGAQPADDGGADSQAVSEDLLESDEFKTLIREQVKETVREQLPKLMRKLMGDIFQKKVLPKLIDHTDQRIDKLFDEKLSGEVQNIVRREIDRMLQEE